MCLFVPLVKTYFVTMKEDDTLFKNTYQNCNGFVTCRDRRVLLIYINYLRAVLRTLVLYTEELDPEIFNFQWPDRIKM